MLMLCCLVPTLAQATVYWVEGVNKNSGWFDVNKTFISEDEDSSLCWAASSSNMIAWWQEQNPQIKQYAESQGVPTGADAIWARFKECFYDFGFDPYWGNRWFFDGAPEIDWTDETLFLPLKLDSPYAGGSFYKDIVSNSSDTSVMNWGDTRILDETGWVVLGKREITDFSRDIKDAILAGNVVSLALSAWYGDHAVTLWGIDYDDEKDIINSLYITDSDDWAKTKDNEIPVDGLLTINLKQGTAPLYPNDEQSQEMMDVYFMFDNLNEEGAWYHGEEYIYSFTTLNRTVQLANIPEPATGTLGLLALAALAARRRRKG